MIQPGMEQFIESVRDGTLDFTLTKPQDTQLIVSIKRVDIWRLIDIALGLAVLATALIRLSEKVGGWQAGAFVLMLMTGGTIIYSFFLILATLSFWFVRVENILVIFQSMYEAGRWPMSLYPGWLRYGLTFVIPVAFATTVPAEALTGRLTWETLLGAVILALVLIIVSRVFWRVGLRHYTGTSA
jgi:ABC-2 type transport system permease protein